jgi:hypothetical protein
MFEDQQDFHTYSVRKNYFRSYMSMLRWEDNLRKQPWFFKAASGAVKVFFPLLSLQYFIFDPFELSTSILLVFADLFTTA